MKLLWIKKLFDPLLWMGFAPSQDYGATIEERVYFLTLSPQEVLGLIWSTSEWWKATSNLEPTSGFEPATPGLGIQRPKH